ncbi:MAG: ribulokinase [Chitinophagaceae bacterium]
MTQKSFVIGVDYGTDSVRSILVDASNGMVIASSVFQYPRWKDGLYCQPAKNQFRQHPLDYVEGLAFTIKECIATAGKDVAANIKAISIDTTGSSPVAVNEKGEPLALVKGFETNPNAMFVLWKDHTSVQEAAEINEHAQKFPVNYLDFTGGIYSSEWFWAKLLRVLRVDEEIRPHVYSFVEHCDWIPFLLTGGNHISQMKRSRCAAGHKALWAEEFGGLPPDDFFSSWDPLLKGFTSRLFTDTYTSDQSAGNLSKEWADKLGLSTNVIVGVGAFDAHMGAVGGQIEPYHLSKVMGTSTCDMLVAPMDELKGKLVRGICGQVPGSVIPGMMGLEAGQSAFGDAYAWFRNLIAWPLQNILSASVDKKTIEEAIDKIIPELTEQAQRLDPADQSEYAIDWFNGRRTPDANQLLKGAFTGLNLGSEAPQLFRAVVEATCFGARAIVERFKDEKVPVKGLIGLGGVAKKSPFIMQMMADVMNMPIRIHRSEQTCALGAAMFAATAAGLFPNVEEAMKAMGHGFDATYLPDAGRAAIYNKRYAQYKNTGNFLAAQTVTKKEPVLTNLSLVMPGHGIVWLASE